MLSRRHMRFAARYAAHRFRALHPFEVQASLLNACNLRCAYCRCPDVKIEMMTTEQWVKTVEGLGSHGTMRIKYQGGEPTMRADFRTICAASQAAGILTAVVTNGQQFAAKPDLLDHLDEIVFSLDSATPEHNDRMRGAGVHAGVVEAIGLARERGINLFINMVVTRDNLGEIEPMLDFCEAGGIGLHVQPAVAGRKYYDDAVREFALDDAQIRTMHARLGEWKRQGRPLMFAAVTYENVLNWSDFTEISRRMPGESTCMAGKFYVHIEPNGDVHPCNQHDSVFEPKNIVRDGLDAALAHTQQHDCGDCFSVYLNERKAVFGMRPIALWEMARRG
ncbi:MAG: radical SAM protein [Candidatus Binatia bacterium]